MEERRGGGGEHKYQLIILFNRKEIKKAHFIF